MRDLRCACAPPHPDNGHLTTPKRHRQLRLSVPFSLVSNKEPKGRKGEASERRKKKAHFELLLRAVGRKCREVCNFATTGSIFPAMSQLTRLFFLCLLACCSLTAAAQKDSIPTDLPKANNGEAPAMPISIEVGKSLYKGDSIPAVIFQGIYKYPPLDFANEKDRQNYSRLVQNVKLLLPLAKMVRTTIVETYDYLQTLPTKKARQAHINAVEEDLKKEYTPLVNRLSRSQGRLLVKLIDRETNQTGYQIAKAFVGSFKANFYQGISFFFGLNLNKHYEPEGDDRFTERVVRMVESGQL